VLRIVTVNPCDDRVDTRVAAVILHLSRPGESLVCHDRTGRTRPYAERGTSQCMLSTFVSRASSVSCSAIRRRSVNRYLTSS